MLQIEGLIKNNFSYFSDICCDFSLEPLQRDGCNAGLQLSFYRKIRKIISKLSLFALLIWCTDDNNFLNSLTTEKQTTKFSSANVKKKLSPSYIIQRIQKLEGKQGRP